MNNDPEVIQIETLRHLTYYDDSTCPRTLPPARYVVRLLTVDGFGDVYTEVHFRVEDLKYCSELRRFWLEAGREFKHIDALTLLAESAE